MKRSVSKMCRKNVKQSVGKSMKLSVPDSMTPYRVIVIYTAINYREARPGHVDFLVSL